MKLLAIWRPPKTAQSYAASEIRIQQLMAEDSGDLLNGRCTDSLLA
jgi:hypothetical protein